MADASTVAPYGKWDSPITAEHLSGDSIHLEGVQANPLTGKLFVLESRPAEGGRYAVVELTDASAKDVLAPKYSAMGTIHEYGGGSIAMHPNGRLLFTNHPNNGIFLLDPASGQVETVVAPDADVRYGNFNVHPTAQEWIVAVQETHTKDSHGSTTVTNTIVAIHVPTANVSNIVQGADFYQHPQFSPDGSQICWTQWDHPDMPWTGTLLCIASWEPNKLLEGNLVSGQAGVESICQPRWSIDGTLFYVSDKSGYWQLYRFDGAVSNHIHLDGLESAEFGSREPCLANCTYIQLDEDTLVASAIKSATSNLILIDLNTNSWKDLSLPIVEIQKNALARISSSSFAVIGSTRTTPQALYRVDLGNSASTKLLRSTIQLDIPESVISQARHIKFPRVYSKGNAGSANAWLVESKNSAFKGLEGTKPPLLVWMHGGPTYHVSPGLSLTTQYWTSRGYAYVLVNHVGSTGYGRAYRELLDGQWGAADIEDAASCVAYLSSEGIIDPTKVGIVGESAGGYAVMQALYIYPEIWAAGMSIYGICSLPEFAETTHKFESHYIDSLVLGKGDKSKEEIEAIYKSRSAVYHAQNIKAPLLLLQGNVDTVVPAWQATRMEEKMRELGKDIQVVMFQGEGHGFHMAKTIKASTEIQTKFWMDKLL
ncbi:dipeptidyl peptidase IV, putative [Talaromyces stipitatus ATCC 10500]|uniref:Dipeptidyl peptidase IV, putative n=1 Tax=Talaromyces stipitatus (strain ATCC 10500 / CBS 375.48 / QM 6759 / NRRL 1006) TaxID=441959 RepID=B8LTF8_TALSN|nr:dipeptidyl peptidase IV, putative [Talaromyces stipitatus ATCC 10500]EED23036.1 dipeptidyl peptidase IV, putative [Talaromyces stipitatus ATCC 10500]